MSLKFNEGNHSYYLDGKRVPGVTGIIGNGIPKPAIPRWAAKTVAEYVADNLHELESWSRMGRESLVAALKQAPWTARDEAAVRGTDVHNIAEQILHDGEADVPDHLAAHVQGYVEWLDRFEVEPILTEVPVANREHRYAGKPDFIGQLHALDPTETWLLDWKTSKGVYGETALQTAAYAGAEFYVVPDQWDDEKPMPHIDRIGVVHVIAGGTELYDFGPPEPAYQLFLDALAVADGKRRRDGFITDPVHLPARKAS